MMHELHQEGKTIVLITHDSGIAGQANRIIRLQDGMVLDDSGVAS